MLLNMIGHDAKTAFDGRTAIQIALEFTPDVVLMDMKLPDMSGDEAVNRMKSLPQLAKTTFVAWSGRDLTHDPRAAIFDTQFMKPSDTDELEQWLANWQP